MIARFSLYDFIAVVVPGVFFVWVLSVFLELSWAEPSYPRLEISPRRRFSS